MNDTNMSDLVDGRFITGELREEAQDACIGSILPLTKGTREDLRSRGRETEGETDFIPI